MMMMGYEKNDPAPSVVSQAGATLARRDPLPERYPPTDTDPLGQRDKPDLHAKLEQLNDRLSKLDRHVATMVDRIMGHRATPPGAGASAVEMSTSPPLTALVSRALGLVDSIENELDRAEGMI